MCLLTMKIETIVCADYWFWKIVVCCGLRSRRVKKGFSVRVNGVWKRFCVLVAPKWGFIDHCGSEDPYCTLLKATDYTSVQGLGQQR